MRNIKQQVIFSVIFLLIGYMVTLQLKSVGQPEIRDTRDLFEVREEIKREQKNQQYLYKELEKIDETIEQYTEASEEEKINTLQDSVSSLKKQAGLTEITSTGLTITISPILYGIGMEAQTYPTLSSDLLRRLINELNKFGADHIAIETERLTSISPIREVNGRTYVNQRPVPPLPVHIYVVTDYPDRVRDFLEVSESRDIFAIEDMEITVKVEEVTLPKYEGHIEIVEIELAEEHTK
ncbi:DUF881 domain-containing protein [Bacillaceae bacterium S4-13-56]